MPVARLRLRITSHWVGSDTERAARSISIAQSSDSGRGFRLLPNMRSSRNMRSWVKWSLIFAPAAFTMAKHVLGLAAGTVALGVVAGAAAAPWVALAFTAARNSSEMGEAGSRYAQGLARVESAWMKLARDTSSLTLGPVTDVLNGIAAAIPKLEPLVRDVAPDMAAMGRDIGQWLSGNGFERFVQNVRDYGVPAFRNLVAAGKDFLAGIGIGFRHFLPIAQGIAEELRAMAGRGLGGAQGGGFARWMRDWRSNAPAANKVLRETATALGTFFQLLDDAGPGLLTGLSGFLDLVNSVDPKLLTALILGWASGRFLLGAAAALAGLRAMNALRNVGFTITAANLSRAAALLSAAGGVINGMATAITNLARMVVANARISVNSSALDNIKSIWDSIPKNASVTLAAPSLNLAIVAMMGVNSTVAALVSNAASPAAFAPRLDAGLFFGVMAIVTVAWAAVRAISLAPVIFTAAAIPGNVLLVAAQITALWARARALATLPALFSASATPGNVAAVANQIVAAWARVRAASAVRPRFIAAGRASGRGASSIVAAWMRVVGMPRAWAATGIVSPGNVPGASASMVSAWMALYGMGRRWHGVATCNFSGASVSIPHGGSVTVGGSSGGDWYDPTNLFVTNPATPFTGRPYNPFVGIPGGGLGGGTTPPAGIGGNIGGINPQDYLDGGSIAPPNPGDFSGGFEEFSKGSGTKRRKVGTFGVGGSKDRHIHIEHDIFVRNEAEFNDLMDQILGG